MFCVFNKSFFQQVRADAGVHQGAVRSQALTDWEGHDSMQSPATQRYRQSAPCFEVILSRILVVVLLFKITHLKPPPGVLSWPGLSEAALFIRHHCRLRAENHDKRAQQTVYRTHPGTADIFDRRARLSADHPRCRNTRARSFTSSRKSTLTSGSNEKYLYLPSSAIRR